MKNIKIRIKIEGKNSKTEYQYPSVRKFIFFANNEAKLAPIFDAGKSITISVWYPTTEKISLKEPHNEIVCKSMVDMYYAVNGFVKEYL